MASACFMAICCNCGDTVLILLTMRGEKNDGTLS